MTTMRRTLVLVAVVLGAAMVSGCKLPVPHDDAEEEGPVADPGRSRTPGEPPAYGSGEDPGQGSRRAHRHRGKHRRNHDGDPRRNEPRRDGTRRRWREAPVDPGDPGGMGDPGGTGDPGGWGGRGWRRRGMPQEPPSSAE